MTAPPPIPGRFPPGVPVMFDPVPWRERNLNEGWKIFTHTKLVTDEATPQYHYRPRSWWAFVMQMYAFVAMPHWDGMADGREAIDGKYEMLRWCARYMLAVGVFLTCAISAVTVVNLGHSRRLNPTYVAVLASVIGFFGGTIAYMALRVRATVIVNKEREISLYEEQEMRARDAGKALTELVNENRALREMLALTDEEADKLKEALQAQLRRLRSEDA